MCTTCFQGADPLMRAGLNAGIGVLMGVTAVVLATFALFFLMLARKARTAGLEGDPSRWERTFDVALGAVPVPEGGAER